MRPVRIVHLGLGGFFRAHQAWYTGAAPDAGDWGISAFSGRSCDNLPGNGTVTARVVTELAEAADPALAGWIRGHVSFVSTMVDRITPRTTGEDVRAVAERTGWHDAGCCR